MTASLLPERRKTDVEFVMEMDLAVLGVLSMATKNQDRSSLNQPPAAN